jgi:hypothetical protein
MARKGVTLLIERPSGKAPFRLLIAPLPESGNKLLDGSKSATALILITDPERIATVPGDHLRSIFRLTQAAPPRSAVSCRVPRVQARPREHP